jgi:hypothetical protein
MKARERALLLFPAGLVCLAAWLLPAEKPHAVLGRLSYLQFVAAALSTLLFALGVVLAVCPASARRAIGFRVAAIVLAVLAVLVPYEIICFLMRPLHLMDNPWYPTTGDALEAHPDLPFVRPAHLRWEGISRGDLAILNGDADPYARQVTFQTDHEGFRNSSDLSRAELIFLGDSFTEAGNVPEEETFVRLVAGELQMTARNLGRAGYSPPTELIVLREYGLACGPRIVVWQIAENNDLTDAVRYRKWVAAGRPPYTRSDTRGQFSRGESWQHRSPTFRLFASLRLPKPWEGGPSGTFVDAAGHPSPVRMLYVPDPTLRPEEHPGFGEILHALREGHEMLRTRDIRLVVFLVPMKLRAMARRMEFDEPSIRLLTSRGLDGPDWDVPEENTLAFQLKQRCAELGIPFADATPRLRERAADGGLVYLAYDTHLSPDGHHVVAELITEAVRPR